jgi:xeroderma pigmentosum group C-complementing protein
MARGTRRQDTSRAAGKRPLRSAKGKQRASETSNPVPAGFRELLEEETRRSKNDDGRGPKRRRVESRKLPVHDDALFGDSETQEDELLGDSEIRDDVELQTVTLSSDEEETWEDVDIGQDDEQPEALESENLELVLGETPRKTVRRRRARKPATSAEKKARLVIHKLHLLSLLYHGFLRNHWCNDASIQKKLRDTRIIPSKSILKLHSDPSSIQLQRSRIFREGLDAVLEAWRLNYRIVGYGIQRCLWPASPEESQIMLESARRSESYANLVDFRRHALDFEGSADSSAQLFCALLRSLEVDARLVFSLQPLGFDAKGAGPLPEDEIMGVHQEEVPGLGENTTTPQRISRMGRPNGSASKGQTPRQRHAIPRHAVFWVEAFDAAYQKWIPMDPAVTGTIGKGSVFEPALNDPENSMTYVIAYERSGAAKDVTRRYTKAYIAKTRKSRVESADGGDGWYKRALRPFRQRQKLPRDEIEDGMLLQREISEGMPKNVEDFKNHPVYVLERHLRRDQVLRPKHKVGQISQRGGASSRIELVYRRQDVHVVKSADKWFRLGRQIKEREIPLKRIVRKRRTARDDLDELQEEDTETVAMYAAFQTELYVPDPVINGRVPRNGFRNLDIYVPSMIPPGGVHIKSRLAKTAARIIGVDAVDAVTGFTFKGRHGTAQIDGVVVASEFKDAVVAVCQGLAREEKMDQIKAKQKRDRKEKEKARTEKKIRARIRREYGSDDESFEESGSDSEEESEDELPDFEDEIIIAVESTARVSKPEPQPEPKLTKVEETELFGELEDRTMMSNGQDPGGFILDETEEIGGFIIDDLDLQSGGGFVGEVQANSNVETELEDTILPERTSAEPMAIDSPQKQLSTEISRQENQDMVSKRSESAEPVASPGSMLSHDPEDEDAEPDWL